MGESQSHFPSLGATRTMDKPASRGKGSVQMRAAKTKDLNDKDTSKVLTMKYSMNYVKAVMKAEDWATRELTALYEGSEPPLIELYEITELSTEARRATLREQLKDCPAPDKASELVDALIKQ